MLNWLRDNSTALGFILAVLMAVGGVVAFVWNKQPPLTVPPTAPPINIHIENNPTQTQQQFSKKPNDATKIDQEENTKVKSFEMKNLQNRLDNNSALIKKNRTDKEKLYNNLAIPTENCKPLNTVISECIKKKDWVTFANDFMSNPDADYCAEKESRVMKIQDKQSCVNVYLLDGQLKILDDEEGFLEKERGYINEQIIELRRGKQE